MLKLFTVYDSKTEAFIQPFYELTTAAALRSFAEAANTEKHAFSKSGADYTLFELGTFDQTNAKFAILDAPINLGLALMLKQVNEVIDSLKAERDEEAGSEATPASGKGEPRTPSPITQINS